MGNYNLILAGEKNKLDGCTRCTIINGSSNVLTNITNTHILGDNFNKVDPVSSGTSPRRLLVTEVDSDSMFLGCGTSLQCTGDIVSSYSSDKNLKKNIKKINNCLDKILSLDAINFTWNENQQTYQGKDVGLIAQQVQKIAPEIVIEGSDGYLKIKYEKIIPLLIGAIREQEELIKQIEEKINGPK